MDRKEQLRKRMMAKFIISADEIMQKEGFDKITIRNVAQLAGYNSATLYNYFDDLDHLLFYMSMRYLAEYSLGIERVAEHYKDSLERYLGIWSFFIDQSFEKPKMFYEIFFSPKYRNLLDVTMIDYYDLFPEEWHAQMELVKQMYGGKNLYVRNRILLEELARDGYILEKNINRINTGTIYAYQAVLNDLRQEIRFEHFKEELMDIIGFFITGDWEKSNKLLKLSREG